METAKQCTVEVEAIEKRHKEEAPHLVSRIRRWGNVGARKWTKISLGIMRFIPSWITWTNDFKGSSGLEGKPLKQEPLSSIIHTRHSS